MKKNTGSSKKPHAKGKGEAPARAMLKWRKPDEIITSAITDDKGNMHLELVEPQEDKDGKKLPVCTLNIYPTNYDFDNGTIELLGFSIRVQIRSGKNGMFISFPQEKGKDGNYYDRVSCFDKNFHAMIKTVLSGVYEDEGGEEQ